MSSRGTSASGSQPGGSSSTKKKKYHQNYSSAWEVEPEFHGWLKPSTKGSYYYFCSACNTDLSLNAGKLDIRKHAMGKKHIQFCKTLSKQVSVVDMPSLRSKQITDKQVKEAEIRLASFICEHDIPIRVIEHMPQLIQTICPDSKIAKDIKCGRTKLTSMIKNVTGKQSTEQLITHLQNSKFSLLVDESTDKSCFKHLCMVARTLIEDEVKDCFLGLIKLEDATALTLYNNVVDFFRDKQINYKENMIGFAADGANAMLGAHNSLSARLKNDVDGLFIMKCICHTFALCASHACLKLPRSIEDLARDVFSYIQCSPKRIGLLKEFQVFVNVKPHKLLHPSQTRWLSLHMVVARLLEQYDALTLYFTEAAFTERLQACHNILEKLKHPLTKLYLQFLDFVLPIFNSLNKLMQSECTQIHTMHKSVSVSFKTLAECYLDERYLEKTPLSKIALGDPHKFKPLASLYLGAKVGTTLSREHNIPPQAVEEFQKSCLAFYIEGTTQIRKRFPFSDDTFRHLEALDPKVVKSKSLPSIAPLMSSFPTLANDRNIQTIDSEWRLLRNSELLSEEYESPINFWLTVRNARAGNNDPMFPTLSNFMLDLLCLPHSSATVERVFSEINRMKSKLRNRLSTETMTGILHTKRLMKNKKCYNFALPTGILRLMSSDLYKQDSVAREDTDSDAEDVM